MFLALSSIAKKQPEALGALSSLKWRIFLAIVGAAIIFAIKLM